MVLIDLNDLAVRFDKPPPPPAPPRRPLMRDGLAPAAACSDLLNFNETKAHFVLIQNDVGETFYDCYITCGI